MSNRLICERSPYLRAHADDPVDWYPWCTEAFEKARTEDKPILLSVGYSTCHWCHVMARESFRNETTAAILNRGFVSVKVDREERPDVDSVYMGFVTALNGSGGWPMTLLLTPEGQPFFAASYLPREDTNGQPGLNSLLRAVEYKWKHGRGELTKMARELTELMTKPRGASPAEPSAAILDAAAEQLRASYDEEYGGFGTAPKFPAPQNLLFLLRLSKSRNDLSLRKMAENTLRQIYRGGIYDHFGGGFCRYSTDREWLAPHFEKTLYDNALLAFCYTEAWQDGHVALWRTVTEDTLDYCLRELKSEDGGFMAGQDADSGDSEGAYYLFTPDEIKSVLGAEGQHFCECYDITPEGNFKGKSIPNLLLNTRWSFLPEGYDEFREKLRLYRAGRMELKTDGKRLTAWNGLMLMALSRAAWVFEDRRYLLEAQELAAFIESKLTVSGRLYAVRMGTETKHFARLDDCAFYALGLLELYRADRDAKHIRRATELADEIGQRFADADGGYYSTADDAEVLILRPKESHDGALPCGNSAAAMLFDALGRLMGEQKYRESAERQLRYLCGTAGDYPAGVCFGLCALLPKVYGSRELVLALPDESIPATASAVLRRYAPELSVLFRTPANAALLSELAPFTADMTPINGKPACYVCADGQCGLPVEI